MTTYVVAEVAQAHDGSLGAAHAYIDATAKAGADAVKFQTHIAEAESTPGEPWRVRFSSQDETRYDYWRRMEFTEPQWQGLRDHADEAGIDFISSPFSLEAVELLARVGVAAWKVASGEVSNLPLLERIATHGGPVFLSSGMSPIEEIDTAVELFRGHGIEPTVLQCTSEYPCPPEKVGLNLIDELRERYGGPVGLSDHSGTIYPGLAAATIGIDVLEVHITLSKESFGPDVPASITTEELRVLVDGIRFIETALANPVEKDGMATELQPLRDLFTKSIVAAMDLPAGSVIEASSVALKKPGGGMPAAELEAVIGRVTTRALSANEQLSRSDLEDLDG